MSAQSNIETAKRLGLTITWESIAPQPAAGFPQVDFTDAEKIPQSVVKRFKSTKGLGKSVSRQTDYALMVRTNPADKQVYLLVNPNAEKDRARAAERKAARNSK